MKVYIAGAISKNLYHYQEEFSNAEQWLLGQGYEVINPAKNQGYSYKDYIDTGLFELMHCEAIYMLKGYEKSKGALLEIHYAIATDMKILYQR